MIPALIAWSTQNRMAVFAASIVLAVLGALSAVNAPLDAVPDLSDTQVVVATEWMGRSADVIEDQVTWRLSTALLGTSGARTVRGQSMAGMSLVYVIFEDGTDAESARTRVAEILGRERGTLPVGANAKIGPDASGVGWVYQYALVDRTGKLGPAELRLLQETILVPALRGVEGVAEIATVGGYVKQIEVSLDPDRMLTHGVSFEQVATAVASANSIAGGGSMELSGNELVLRGRNDVAALDDIADAPIGSAGTTQASMGGTPARETPGVSEEKDGMAGMGSSAPNPAGVATSTAEDSGSTPHLLRVRDVAEVQWASAPRRGVAELNGQGETTGGIVVAQQGQNALRVIEAAKSAGIAAQAMLPEGVELVTVYDRAPFITDAVATLSDSLTQELLAVAVVILIFLGHFRSALVPVLTLPVAVLVAFIPMYLQGITINVVSLAGIAVAVGAMVDASIVVVENIHVRLAEWESQKRKGEGGKSPPERSEVVLSAMQEVGPAAFGSLLVIAISFVPVFVLEGREGRLFSPLAWTKTWSMFIAAGLAITLAPALAVTFVRGKPRSEEDDRVSQVLTRLYSPVVRIVVRSRWIVVGITTVLFGVSLPLARSLPWEFMPPLDEGTLLYMPTAPPGISEAEAARVLQAMDAELMKVPEVATVFGKMGRADSATDPAPLSMAETVIQLKPRAEWRDGLTPEKLVSEMDGRMQVPGFANAWWMPVQTRIEMLSTGLRSPLGLKISGADLALIEAAAVRIEGILAKVPGTRSAFADRSTGGLTLDVELRRAEAGALGVTAADVGRTISNSLGGQRVGERIDGRIRTPIVVRYAHDFRGDIASVREALVERESGAPVPLATVADVREGSGPEMIRSEDGQLVGYVFVDPGDTPVSDWVDAAEEQLAKAGIAAGGGIGDGMAWSWAGTFRDLERALTRLAFVVPFVALAIAGLLRANTGSWAATAIVMATMPLSLIGASVLMWGLDYHWSVAAVVGLIALAGVDAETSVVMLLYLKLAYSKLGPPATAAELEEIVVEGAARRMRPKLMTVATDLIGFIPIFLISGTGADLARRIAAPMVGGLISSFAVELLVYPALFAIWMGGRLPRQRA